MPDYLAPGVYVGETSFRSKSIEGVSTTTTGFVGPTRYGPIDGSPELVTSLSDFGRVYGDGRQLGYGGVTLHNYLWHASRAFFENGGSRLYIARVFRPLAGSYPPANFATATQTTPGLYDDGHARANIGSPSQPTDTLTLRARFPGAAGSLRVQLTVNRGRNLLGRRAQAPTLRALANDDIVWIGGTTLPGSSSPQPGTCYLAEFDTTEQTWRFKTRKTSAATDLRLQHTNPRLSLNPALGTQVRVITVTVTIFHHDGSMSAWETLPLDPDHQWASKPDSLFEVFGNPRAPQASQRPTPLVITLGDTATDGLAVVAALAAHNPTLAASLNNIKSTTLARSVAVTLSGGNDGQRPAAEDYRGDRGGTPSATTGLHALEAIEDISIVAAPGSPFGMERDYRDNALAIVNGLITHAERMRYRFALLDSGDGQSVAQVQTMRAQQNSPYAALYYPWVRVLDPVTQTEIHLPPSGFVAGIYARNDIEQGVYKAPANAVVTGAIGFETVLNKSQQDILNPEGINCFRFFVGRGFRLWGARTISADPEWRYVNVRRYTIYLQRSIDRGTQWAVFEPNGDALWANIHRTIEDFLFNEWKTGALLGTKPAEAYFVTCNRSTMTQADLDVGRLVCLIGVALVKPAEFVIFRIGQWTASHTP